MHVTTANKITMQRALIDSIIDGMKYLESIEEDLTKYSNADHVKYMKEMYSDTQRDINNALEVLDEIWKEKGWKHIIRYNGDHIEIVRCGDSPKVLASF